uniref:Ubiquitin-like protease family profile domain-containing protein n=1 Tax=Anopheles minimus TaxID=112268 RepID=A0A182W1W2_9DIPT
MFPTTLISRLKSLLTGGGNVGSGECNDPPAEEVGNRSNNTLRATASAVAGSIQLQNGAHGEMRRLMANPRRLSDITDMPRVNHVDGLYNASALGSIHRSVAADSRSSDTSSKFATANPRPLARRSGQAPPQLIPIKYVMSRPSIGQRSSGGSGTGPKPSAVSGGLFRPSVIPSVDVCSGNVSTLTNEFRNMLRSKSSITPTSGSDYTTALDRELNAHREATKKYESLMQKFIPITNEPPERGAYDRFVRKSINGDISRPTLQKQSSIETLDLSDEGDIERESTSDDCVEVVSHSKSGRLFAPLDSMLTLAREHENAMKEAATSFVAEPVNTVKERFETKQFYRDDIIQDVQQRYGTLFSQRKSLIEQEKDRLGSLRRTTHVQENEARNKMLNYMCSFYKFDVLNETDEKESTPEPEVVPLPELTKEQLDQMYRKLRTGNQVVVEKFNLRITGNDLVTLQDLNWLNDAAINFYMELLRERSELKREQGLPKVYTMNTFFLPQLLKMGYSGVRRWTRKVDLLAHDMIVVPVHVGGIHWCMSIIDLRRKTIDYYDSMGSPNNVVLNALEEYLCQESMDKRKKPFDKSGLTKQNMRDCPRQKNGSDCGVFSCMFAEFLTRDHAITFDQSNMPYFRKKMTVEIMMGKLLT